MHNLEYLLLGLCRYGEPMLFKMRNGWLCKIEVFVTGKGVKFEVGSESNRASPTAAVEECFSRLEATIAQMASTQLTLTTTQEP